MQTCKNCKTKFKGKYCNTCGEKVVEQGDFTVKSIVGQAVGAITNLDSKVFQSFKLLLFFPSKLTSKYVEGIRMPYMKPFQIFLICNIIFFIFLGEIDLFRTPSKWFFSENFDGLKVMDIVRGISAEKGLTKEEIAVSYDKKSLDYSKGLIFLLIPFIALVGKLLNLKKKVEYGKHLIFATHFFSFVLLICVLVAEFVALINDDFSKWLVIGPITFLMVVYYTVGMKNFYQNSWALAITKGVVGIFLINIIIQFYRISINLLSLNMI